MRWAVNRLRQEQNRRPASQPQPMAATQPVRVQKAAVTQPVRIAAIPLREKVSRKPAVVSISLFLLGCLVVAAAILVDATPALAFISGVSGPQGGQAGWAPIVVSKPFNTLTPLPTAGATQQVSVPPTLAPLATATATATATTIATATPSPLPLPSDTPEPSPTPLPTDTPPPYEAPVVSAPHGTNGEKWILVDISEQHLYAYEGNTLIYSFVASTGMRNATRVGTFSVLDKIPNAYGSTWNIWMPDWLGIYYAGGLENGIHSLPILPNGQRLWAGYLGTPISFGCVVLGVEESRLLYDWAEIGTTVVIQR
jgi:lipoprotein-anchoring transpeptidase ErfK/SrfK